MKIDVLVKKPAVGLPPLDVGQLRYVVAENGVFLERRAKHYRTSCPIDGSLAGLAAHGTYCELSCEQVPARLVGEMLGFFRWAYEEHGGEAALILLYNEEKRAYSWLCPRQTVELWENWWGYWYASGMIAYEEPMELPPGCVAFGDAHSHAESGAHPSAIDEDDERYKDGLHIIAGRIHKDAVDFHLTFVMDGTRFRVAPELVLGEVDDAEVGDFPPAWKRQVVIERRAYERRCAQQPPAKPAPADELPAVGRDTAAAPASSDASEGSP